MRYTIANQQFHFFKNQSYITFESLFTPEELAELRTLLASAKMPRDPQKQLPVLFKALHLSRFGEIAQELYKKKRILLAYTHYNPDYPLSTLESISSMTEIFGGAILQLNTGDTTFYTSTLPIDFPTLEKPSLLLVFCSDQGRYKFQENDPFTYLLKKEGLAYGDQITAETHPLIAK